MYRKIGLVLMIIALSITVLFAEKSLERLGNEAEFAGDELYSAKDYPAAIVKYEEAVAKFNEAKTTDNIPVDDKLARIDEKLFKSYYFGKDYENAIRVKKDYLKVNPKDIKAAKIVAQLYEKKLKDIPSAISFLIEYDQTNPGKNVIVKKIASFYRKVEDNKNALVWYKKSYAIKQDSKVIKNIAILHNQLGQTSEAVKAYEDFIKTNPSDEVLAKTYMNMGALYEDMNKIDSAAANFKKSIEVKFDVKVAEKIIVLYHDNGKTSQAKEAVRKLLANDPGNETAVYYTALIAYEEDDKATAKTEFQKLTGSRTFGKSADGYIKSIDSE